MLVVVRALSPWGEGVSRFSTPRRRYPRQRRQPLRCGGLCPRSFGRGRHSGRARLDV